MKVTRVLPEPHRYAVCAPDDMSIKSFYKGIFDEVFIFFHPFIKPISIDYDLFQPETYPGKNDIIENCKMLTWEQFLEISGIESYRQLDIGLRTLILGLTKEFAKEEIANVIQSTCEKHRLIAPTEGLFPELLMNRVLRAIKEQGHDWIWCGDEFCTERKLEYIDDLIKDNNAFQNRRINLFTHDTKILVTTHWDSHFSLFCSDKKTVNKIVDVYKLEGFYCDEQTEIYWSVRNR